MFLKKGTQPRLRRNMGLDHSLELFELMIMEFLMMKGDCVKLAGVPPRAAKVRVLRMFIVANLKEGKRRKHLLLLADGTLEHARFVSLGIEGHITPAAADAIPNSNVLYINDDIGVLNEKGPGSTRKSPAAGDAEVDCIENVEVASSSNVRLDPVRFVPAVGPVAVPQPSKLKSAEERLANVLFKEAWQKIRPVVYNGALGEDVEAREHLNQLPEPVEDLDEGEAISPRGLDSP